MKGSVQRVVSQVQLFQQPVTLWRYCLLYETLNVIAIFSQNVSNQSPALYIGSCFCCAQNSDPYSELQIDSMLVSC